MAILQAGIRGNVQVRRDRAGSLTLGPVLLVSDVVAVLVIGWGRVPQGAAALFALGVVAVLAFQGADQQRFSAPVDRSLPRIVAAAAVAIVPVLWFFGDAAALEFLRLVPGITIALVAVRVLALFTVRFVNKRADSAEGAIVVGAGTTGAQLARHLIEHREYGIEPLGFVDRVNDRDLPLPVLGDVDDLERILRTSGARHLIVAFGVVPEDDLVRVIRRCHLRDVDVWVIPRFFELGLQIPGAAAEEIWGTPLARLPRLALRSAQWRLKRVFDLSVATLGLVLLAPALAAIALAVRLSSPGPVFFRQERIGQRGRAFELLKFRTMLVNDDSTTTWSVDEDQRVTRIGRALRRTSLDELPQLFNVVRGDMSLVGPRPERPYFVERFRDAVRGYDDRHRVPAGITGLAQVNGLRGDTSIEERAIFDNNYIENWTLWSDISILARTAIAITRATPRSSSVAPVIDLRDQAQTESVPPSPKVPEANLAPEDAAVTVAAS